MEDMRKSNELRQHDIIRDFVKTADGSCLISTGNTRVICTASVEESVPAFLKGKNEGWVTAEYAMLPASTGHRKARDGVKKDGRGVEISRLIGRALRQAVDRRYLNGFTITVDCDVLQADGGTRTASITGGFVALALAVKKLMDAVRVPPSASSTSQSSVMVRSPSSFISTAWRRLRPIRRWISTLRPSFLTPSRALRVPVEAGSMAYSAVTQPWPFPRRKGGTPSSTLAVQMTRVLPVAMRQLPYAVRTKSVSMVTGRFSSGCLPSNRVMIISSIQTSAVFHAKARCRVASIVSCFRS